MLKRYVKLCAALCAEDLVKTTSYITRREDIAEYVKVRANISAISAQSRC